MKRIGIALGAVVWLAAAGAQAQEAAPSPFTESEHEAPYQSSPGAEAASPSSHVSWGQLQPTAEMWLYEQQKADYLDPKLAVRRKAEQKSAQREGRIAAMKWYGLSNSRPVANPTPLCGVYSPGWHANNYNSYRWTGGIQPLLVVRPARVSIPAAYGLW